MAISSIARRPASGRKGDGGNPPVAPVSQAAGHLPGGAPVVTGHAAAVHAAHHVRHGQPPDVRRRHGFPLPEGLGRAVGQTIP